MWIAKNITAKEIGKYMSNIQINIRKIRSRKKLRNKRAFMILFEKQLQFWR